MGLARGMRTKRTSKKPIKARATREMRNMIGLGSVDIG
jgi:hypothetical protein